MRKLTAKRTPGPRPSELLLDMLLVLFEGSRGSGDLAETVGELRGGEVALATFYRQLQRAVDLGWIETGGESERPGPGRPERLYRLTEEGRGALEAGMEQQAHRVARAQAAGLLGERAP